MLLIYNVLSKNSIYVLHIVLWCTKLCEGKGTANLKMQFCLICACGMNDPPFLLLQISGMKAEAYSITEVDLWYGL